MTPGNAIQLTLTGALVWRRQFLAFCPFSCLFQTVLPREDQELDLTVRGYILRLPCGIFCTYRMLNFLNHPDNDSPLWNLIIIIIIIIILLFYFIVFFWEIKTQSISTKTLYTD